MASDFMARQRKLLEETEKNNGVPLLKSLYGPVTDTQELDLGDRKPFSTRAGLSTFSEEGANMKAPVDSPFLRSMSSVDRPTTFIATEEPQKKPLNQLTNKTPFEDRAANNLLYSENVPDNVEAPIIRERQDARRDAELGKMTSSAAANKNGGVTKTFSIGGNTLSYNTEDAPEGSFTAGGTDRTLRNLKQPTDASAEYERKFRNMGTNQRVAEPIVSAEQLKQYDYQEGLKSGRTQKPIDPMSGLGNRAKRELLLQQERNKQSGIENAATNAINADRNDILRESNYLQSQVKQRPESKVIKKYDPISGNVIGEEIVTQDASGNWPTQQSFRQPKPATINKLKQMRDRNDPNLAAAEQEFINTFGQLPY